MNDWSNLKLGEVIEIKYGKDHKQLSDGNIPCFGSGGLMRLVDKPLYKNESILIPRKGSLNNIMYQNNPFWTVDTMFWSKIDDSIVNGKFLFYQLTLIDYTNLNVGSAVPSLTVPVLNDIDISIPPLQEQQAIAEVLSSLDDKIDLLHRQNQTLEQMAETLFRQWFIEEAKEEWEERPLSDYFVFMGGYAFKSSSYSDQGLYKVITIKSVQDGFLDVKAATFINDLPINLKDYQKLKIGDILMSLTGNVGRVCIVDREKCLLNQRVAKIEPIESKNMPYAYFYFRQPNMKQKLTYLAKGTAQLNLSPVETLNQKDILPPTERIEVYSTICRPFYEKIIHNKVQIITLEQQRETLLPKLMSGEVRVKLN